MSQKTATVADLRNNFRRVSAWIANGESVEIVRRGKNFARLIPAASSPAQPGKVDFKRQLRANWGEKSFSPATVRAMREAELGGQS